MDLLITICARGGSKGIPGKNVHPVNGVPLIVYSIRHALEFAKETGADVELSTDNDEIAQVAAKEGLKTEYRRPEELASDNAGKLDAIKDVVEYAEQKNSNAYDMILDLDVTSPLRTLKDLQEGISMMQSDPNARNLFSVSPPLHNPYFDMVEENTEGYFDLVKKPEQQMVARQQGPRVYELNASFYVYRRSFFDEDPLTLVGNSLAYIMPHMCFEADEMIDFELLQYLLANNKLDFNFQ
jgi:CMP-N-acetylneuraminic acid synthetase